MLTYGMRHNLTGGLIIVRPSHCVNSASTEIFVWASNQCSEWLMQPNKATNFTIVPSPPLLGLSLFALGTSVHLQEAI
jgi:hypothetical protein